MIDIKLFTKQSTQASYLFFFLLVACDNTRLFYFFYVIPMYIVYKRSL